MDMQRLFERIADHHEHKVEAEEVRAGYLRLLIGDGTQSPQRVEIFQYECVSKDGATVHLVRVGHPDDGEPVLVSPVPSAIIACALR